MELIIILLIFLCLLALIWYLSKRAHAKDDAGMVGNIERAAQNGDVYAEFKLANMYFEGKGVAQNDAQAAKWFLEAARHDHVEAQFIIGTMFEKGDGVSQSDAKAYTWFVKAANQGHNRSKIMLESDKWRLFVASRDEDVQKENSQKEPPAQEITPEQVEEYTLKASQGDVDAQYNLGIMYFHGEGIQKNLEEALYWFLKAAEQDDPDAQYNLGFMYGKGEGVEKSREQSMQWFVKAAQQGHVEAREVLDKMMKKPG